MTGVRLLLCLVTTLLASVTLLDLASAQLNYQPSLPKIDPPKTVMEIEPYTTKVVLIFVSDLEQKCPRTSKFKAFFERLRGFAKYVIPFRRKEEANYDKEMNAKAGGLFKSISTFAIGKVRAKITEEKNDCVNTFRSMRSMVGRIMGGRKKEESEANMKLTAEQQKEIKEGILKWQTVITRVANTMVISTSNSSSEEGSVGKESSTSSTQKSVSVSPTASPSNTASGSTESTSKSATGSTESTSKIAMGSTGSPSNSATGSTGSPSSSATGSTGSPSNGVSGSTGSSSSSATGSTGSPSNSVSGSTGSSSKSATVSTGSASNSAMGSIASPSNSAMGSTGSPSNSVSSGSSSSAKGTTTTGTSTTGSVSGNAQTSQGTSTSGTVRGNTQTSQGTSTSGAVSGNAQASQTQGSSVTVEQVENQTSQEVSKFLINLEKKCPPKEEYKAFFEQLKVTMVAPRKERKGLFARVKSAVGKITGAMGFLRSRITNKSAEVKKNMETYQAEIVKTLQELDTIHAQIVSQNKGKTTLVCTPAQQTQIKQTITKWEQVTTKFVETSIQTETRSSSSTSSSGGQTKTAIAN